MGHVDNITGLGIQDAQQSLHKTIIPWMTLQTQKTYQVHIIKILKTITIWQSKQHLTRYHKEIYQNPDMTNNPGYRTSLLINTGGEGS